jgi:succinyl-CoA synthetase beta subunit
VNIFGGIMRCDVIAEGVIDAASEIGCTLPIVVRMDGTLVEEGKRLLNESSLNVRFTHDLVEGVESIVGMVGRGSD